MRWKEKGDSEREVGKEVKVETVVRGKEAERGLGYTQRPCSVLPSVCT